MRHGPRPKFRRHERQPPENDEVSLTDRELLSIRETAYREALHQAWFATALEQTKSVFTLASAGVGLALTLIFADHTKPVESWAPIWLLFSAASFGLSAGFCIWVFRVNGRLVAKLAGDIDHQAEDGLVGRLDRTSRILFGSGIILLLSAAVSQIWL